MVVKNWYPRAGGKLNPLTHLPTGNFPGSEGPSALTGAKWQRVDLSTPHLPTSPSAAPGGLHTPLGKGSPPRHPRVPEDPFPPLRGEAWARRSPQRGSGHAAPLHLSGWRTARSPRQPRKRAAQERAPLPQGPSGEKPLPQAAERCVGKGRGRWGRGMSCPHTAGWSGLSGRAGVPLSEGLTCRLRPPGPGRRQPGRRGGGEAEAAAELSPSGCPLARWRRRAREGGREGGRGREGARGAGARRRPLPPLPFPPRPRAVAEGSRRRRHLSPSPPRWWWGGDGDTTLWGPQYQRRISACPPRKKKKRKNEERDGWVMAPTRVVRAPV